MSKTIQDLIDFVPDATEDDVKAAVSSYSRLCSMYAVTELTRSETDDKAYPLPSDFLFKIKVVGDDLPGHYVAGGEVKFTVRPTQDEIALQYGAGHTLDESDEYPLMTDEDAQIIALKLKAIVAGKNDDGVSEYKIGDVQVKGGAAKRVETLEKQYLAAVKAKIGAVGMRSRYD